ncbi:hypothetical protein ACH5RR_008024 [Cinchona calisaya]|uniref:ATPase AAA-type core domain-containing protein n=1 Tax=Cinchona calisaya TaxID=153742 RepID=A0ABD3AAI0_9GENT
MLFIHVMDQHLMIVHTDSLMAPSVVFIDELDNVRRECGLIKGSGGQERDATLNKLANIIEVAAINMMHDERIEVLFQQKQSSLTIGKSIMSPPKNVKNVAVGRLRARKKIQAFFQKIALDKSFFDHLRGTKLTVYPNPFVPLNRAKVSLNTIDYTTFHA